VVRRRSLRADNPKVIDDTRLQPRHIPYVIHAVRRGATLDRARAEAPDRRALIARRDRIVGPNA